MEYLKLAELYSSLEKTSKRLEKTHLISEVLKKTPADDLKILMLLLQGKVFPAYDDRKMGMASRLVLKALSLASGVAQEKIEEDWKTTGDLGLTAEKFMHKKKQVTLFSSDLTIKKVFENLKKLAEMEGEGTIDRKIALVSELLTSARPIEAKYITRTVLEDLRIGVGEGSIRDAIAWAFFADKLSVSNFYNQDENDLNLDEEQREKYKQTVDDIQYALDLTNDFSEVAFIAKTKGIEGLRSVSLVPGAPIKVMLFQKAKNIEEGFEAVGKPAALEYKYDGFRLQIHRNNDKILLYTRRLENVTKQFPDVVEIIKNNIDSKLFILDAEVIGIDTKTKKWLPFQKISQRIKRKYNIDEMIKDTPVMVNIFDAVMVDNEDIINLPFEKRRELIKKITREVPEKLSLAKQIITDNLKEAEIFYKESLEKGNEGIMMKNLSAPYKPGSRVGYGMKIKPIMETLDLVIVGAEWGEGKRASMLSSYIVACIDDDGNLVEVGRVSTGLKEKKEEGFSFEQLTELLKPLIISENGKEVKVNPKIVIEVGYEEIQKSPTYNSGFALRFPRFIRMRDDKSADEASSLETVKELYEEQR